MPGTCLDDVASLERENKELAQELSQARIERDEAHRREVATAEVLKVISRSPTDVHPVFQIIARSAAELCGAALGNVFRFDGKLIHFAAAHGMSPEALEEIRRRTPILPNRGFAAARAVLTNAVEEIPDIDMDADYDRDFARVGTFRSTIAVPMRREGPPIGAITVMRSQAGRFPERQIELLKTFAAQAVIAIENTRLFEAEQASKRELQESLEYQTATSEVLSVISRSPTNVQPVLDTIVATGARLCEAEYALLFNVRDGMCTVAASNNTSADFVQYMIDNPVPLKKGGTTPRAALEGRTIHVHDVLAWPDYELQSAQKVGGQRTILSVPLMRDDRTNGVLTMMRRIVRPFTDRQVKLAETFADQAVIAIENTRLFEAEQTRSKELQESLEYQTASSIVLEAISRSPTELIPVLQTIAEMAARMCGNKSVAIWLPEGDAFRLRVTWGLSDEYRKIEEAVRLRPARGSIVGRVALTGQVEHIHDCLQDLEYGYKEDARIGGLRTILGVPLLRTGQVVGVITLWRYEVDPFSAKQIEMVSTFANQAVIAIENTRLFEEVQARTRELTESLEYQTATAGVLEVISRSPNALQPILDAIVENAARLCEAEYAIYFRVSGDHCHLIASNNVKSDFVQYLLDNPIPVNSKTAVGRAALERRSVDVPDLLAWTDFGRHEVQKIGGQRSVLCVPLLRGDFTIGVIALMRSEVRAFTERQIKLVETFADQAIIAVNNVGLFEEVQARNKDLTALGEVGRAVSSTLDLKLVLKTIVERAVELSGTDAGSLLHYSKERGVLELGETTGLDQGTVAKLRGLEITAKDTRPGEALATRQPLQVPDLIAQPSDPLRDAVVAAGFRASLVVPLFSAAEPLGTLILRRRRPGEFSNAVVNLMQSFADQSAIALENARLFEEIARKSRELEIASQHKSQFVANMSHELRTPLAAILGYAELMQEGFYGALSEKSTDALTRIRSNGKHLLGLINTVLDIAKIESGQFSLNLGEYAIDSVVETVRAATESLAATKKLVLATDIEKRLPVGLGDEQRLTQVLLNLVGNALKFTDTGEVRITATAMNSHFTVSVADTGPGIPTEHQARIFEQFHQVDNSNTKAKGGTGLGLAIAKQIVEMHGGRIWVESTLGRGATFQMQLPIRAEVRKAN